MADDSELVSGVSGRYASALFSLAHDRRETSEVAAQLASFSRLIVESPDLQRLVRSPVFSSEEQLKALGPLLDKAGINGITANFIRLVAAKRRLFALPEMIEDYARLNDAFRGARRGHQRAAADRRQCRRP